MLTPSGTDERRFADYHAGHLLADSTYSAKGVLRYRVTYYANGREKSRERYDASGQPEHMQEWDESGTPIARDGGQSLEPRNR